MEVVTEDVVDVVYANSSSGPPLWDGRSVHRTMGPGEAALDSESESASEETPNRALLGGALPRGGSVEQVEELTVVWTCPDWEVDWISEILSGAGIRFRMVFDAHLEYVAPNALVALSQNDERNRPPHVLARYLLRFRRRGWRVGVLHMSGATLGGLVGWRLRDGRGVMGGVGWGSGGCRRVEDGWGRT
jgi:hypothetical protein